jgi:hypothetical protein
MVYQLTLCALRCARTPRMAFLQICGPWVASSLVCAREHLRFKALKSGTGLLARFASNSTLRCLHASKIYAIAGDRETLTNIVQGRIQTQFHFSDQAKSFLNFLLKQVILPCSVQERIITMTFTGPVQSRNCEGNSRTPILLQLLRTAS